MASWFVSAGKENGMSPIALAARARQETGGGSIAISGYIFPDGKYAYNPYNIGAYSNANPVMRGLEYAKKQGWDTKQKAVFGGAKFIASGYIKQVKTPFISNDLTLQMAPLKLEHTSI